jgi:8-oxo-dGTP pyrophosphatase MutT (NUDIX family)
MERIGSRTTHEGVTISVRVDEFRDPDGSTREREVVGHPGAAAIVAHDGQRLYMVRQPREAVGEDSLLELPAGKLDVEGETPLQCAQRELEEEVGLRAAEWSELKRIYTSPGFTDEQVHVFVATGLTEVGAHPSDEERIEIVTVELDDLDEVIEACVDAKSLVGLLLFRDRLR